MVEQTRSLVETAAALIRTSENFDATVQAGLLDDLDLYHAQFRQNYWRDSGRLGRLGLPIPVIALLRKLKELFLAPIATHRGTER